MAPLHQRPYSGRDRMGSDGSSDPVAAETLVNALLQRRLGPSSGGMSGRQGPVSTSRPGVPTDKTPQGARRATSAKGPAPKYAQFFPGVSRSARNMGAGTAPTAGVPRAGSLSLIVSGSGQGNDRLLREYAGDVAPTSSLLRASSLGARNGVPSPSRPATAALLGRGKNSTEGVAAPASAEATGPDATGAPPQSLAVTAAAAAARTSLGLRTPQRAISHLSASSMTAGDRLSSGYGKPRSAVDSNFAGGAVPEERGPSATEGAPPGNVPFDPPAAHPLTGHTSRPLRSQGGRGTSAKHAVALVGTRTPGCPGDPHSGKLATRGEDDVDRTGPSSVGTETREGTTGAGASTTCPPSNGSCCGEEGSEDGSGEDHEDCSADTVAVIKVVDQGSGESKELECRLETLTEHMKYFGHYLVGVETGSRVEISVFCDVGIFEWLLRWAHEQTERKSRECSSTPSISQSISVLIAAHFLQMPVLVEQVIKFVVDNFLKVVFLPLDLTGLADELTERLQAGLTDDSLEAAWVLSHDSGEVMRRIHDAAQLDKPPSSTEVAEQARRIRLVVNKLYRSKLQLLVGEGGGCQDLTRCTSCSAVYPLAFSSALPCPSARMHVTHHGEVAMTHTGDPSWSVQDYVTELRGSRLPWRSIFWHLWARGKVMYCSRCKECFQGSGLNHCRFHAAPPSVPHGRNAGVYPCCGGTAFKFGGGGARGCKGIAHVVKEADVDESGTDRVEARSTWESRCAEGCSVGAASEALRMGVPKSTLARLVRHKRLVDDPLQPDKPTAGSPSGTARDASKGAGATDAQTAFPRGHVRPSNAPDPIIWWDSGMSDPVNPVAFDALTTAARAARGNVAATTSSFSESSESGSDTDTGSAGQSSFLRGASLQSVTTEALSKHVWREREAPKERRRGGERPFDGLQSHVLDRPELCVVMETLREVEAAQMDAAIHALGSKRVPPVGALTRPRGVAREVSLTLRPVLPIESTAGRSASKWGRKVQEQAGKELLDRAAKGPLQAVFLAGGGFVGHEATGTHRPLKYAVEKLDETTKSRPGSAVRMVSAPRGTGREAPRLRPPSGLVRRADVA